MLRTAPKGETSTGVTIRAEEDRLLRAAFGRYGGLAKARGDAATVVARYQQLGSGQWFLCDCRPDAVHPPALVPVSQTHIRRHEASPWPAHADTCDFYRDPEEQRAITGSYAAPAVDKPLRLMRPLSGEAAPPLERRLDTISRQVTRPGIARLLLELVTSAGLQAIGPEWRPPTLVDQVKAIWSAAKRIEIDSGVSLPEFLCTSPARLGELVARIEGAPAGRFTRTRPHGVLVVRAKTIGAGLLLPVSGEPIPVRGRLAVFGGRADGGRETRAERSARAPYLVACVVGRALEGEPVEVLSAYAHPCADDTHLMLVDSDMERRTLHQLRSVQAWLGSKRDVQVAIEKPMFDLGPEGQGGTEPRAPCIPDFVIRTARSGGLSTTLVVETMGFADVAYRERKRRMHPLMSAALGGASIVTHDFHEPAGTSQTKRDSQFWQCARRALAEPKDGRDHHCSNVDLGVRTG